MPDIDVRPATAAELDAFRFVASTVFGVPEYPFPVHAENTLCAFEDGDLVFTFNAWPFRWNLNGATIDAAGITSVGTLPHRRRRGHLRRIMTEAFRRQRQAGQSMAILWGSHTAIYQRFGCAVVSHDATYQLHPREVDFAVPLGLPESTANGDIHLSTNPALDTPAFENLRAVYDAYIVGRNGELHRDDLLWQDGVLRPSPTEGALYAALYAENDEPLGYALYTVRDGAYDGLLSKHRHPDETQRLTLRELIATTPAAYTALWRHIGAHDLVRWIHYDGAPKDDPLLDLVAEPRMLRRATRDGIMARVVDLAAALPQRPYAAPAACTLRVHDPDCDWNDGVWDFRTDGDHTTVEPSPVEPTMADPQLSLPIHSLASIITGYRSPSHLVRIGRSRATPNLDLSALDRAFAVNHRPHCFQHF